MNALIGICFLHASLINWICFNEGFYGKACELILCVVIAIFNPIYPFGCHILSAVLFANSVRRCSSCHVSLNGQKDDGRAASNQFAFDHRADVSCKRCFNEVI